MALSQFLILSIIIGSIAFTLMITLVMNGWKKCQFCTCFWIGCLLTAIYGYFFGYSGILLVIPFGAVAWCHFINK